MRYLGGKNKLLEFIEEVANQESPGHKTINDLFAGTGVVGSHFRKGGKLVYANDILYFSYCLNVLNLSFEKGKGFEAIGGLEKAASLLNLLEGKADFITNNFSPFGSDSRAYFSIENAMKIDAIRLQIQEWSTTKTISPLEEAALIGLLIKAINRVSNITGTFSAFLKTWDPRALKPLVIYSEEVLFDGPVGIVSNDDIFNLRTPFTEITYLDPPYNQRDYASNYFLLEVIATGWFGEGITPKGVTGMVHFQDKKSTFSSKRSVEESFRKLFEQLKSDVTLMSYSDEGLLPISQLLTMMSDYGEATDLQRSHKRFRSINQDGYKTKLQEHILILKKR